MLDYARITHHQFTYLRPYGRRKLPVTQSWFPGYLFLEIDTARDYWQQIYLMPGVIGLLGSPRPGVISAADMAHLNAELSAPLAPCTPATAIPPGTQVRIIKGSFSDHTAVVRSSDRQRLVVMGMVFGRPTPIELTPGDVEIVA
jgi:transcriptional antiterminator NusG